MRYRCCQISISYFMITYDTLSFCSGMFEDKYAFFNNYKGETGFTEKYIKARNQFIEKCKKDKDIPEQCLKCCEFKEKEWDDSFGIDFIGIANRSKCFCNCIYCSTLEGKENNKKELNTRKIWDIRPVLKELEDNNLLKKTGKVYVAGGECSKYPKEELSWLINFAHRNNFCIEFASSAMFYSEEIGKALRKGNTAILISPDSGTKETYERIKRVKYYDKVWNNIEKYIKDSQQSNTSKVSLKYIILEGINDTIEEFQAFLKKCNELNCKHIEISAEINWLFDDGGRKTLLPKSVENLLLYIKSLNDDRFYSNVLALASKKTISAKEYSKEIEKSLTEGKLQLNIPIYAGTAETYEALTKSNLFDKIWHNIYLYSRKIQYSNWFHSTILLQYKIISGVNDSIEEINQFVKKCDECDLRNIEVGLYNGKNDLNNNFDINHLKQIYDYFNSLEHKYISFSEKFLSLINSN